jgi:preprotein translocase subunit SecE
LGGECLFGTGTALQLTPLEIPMVSPFKFLQEVRSETNKVTWPSRRETAITTVMVFIMASVAAVFFLLADQIIRVAVTFVLGIGS